MLKMLYRNVPDTLKSHDGYTTIMDVANFLKWEESRLTTKQFLTIREAQVKIRKIDGEYLPI